ncbi:glycosyltransferase family protein [Castellaniella defragrans]|uniref:Spore protein YkvP/CgeB glycosyl transferase-like domain-containing protein n=1 Tax=Castellaniella defragrans TaxID=75697 RepID=A0A7W9WP48_CASDE|nr:glycosyltransferase [Castellaniella defragrans]MBB6084094.1 hypothetical protein [Castellaniella defragrans]
MNSSSLQHFFMRARKALGYVARGDFKNLMGRVRSMRQERLRADRPNEILPGTILKWRIVTTRHTLFIAHLIARRLREHGFGVTIATEVPEAVEDHFYVVLCPQIFQRLPPPERTFLFQMEQSVSSRWFTKAYLNTLLNARGVLDYALVNLDFLQRKEIRFPHTNYLPIGSDPDYAAGLAAEDKRYDVLFYGDAASSPRRQALLQALERHFDVHRCSEVFGDEMKREIRRARLVVNLHYYENALLETPRIQECLALGVPVVSESAQDQADYPELEGVVRFFPEGDVQAMVDAVRDALAHPVPAEAVARSTQESWRRFCFMFDRFLVGAKLLPYHHLSRQPLYLNPAPHAAASPPSGQAPRLILSMPETITRRRDYLSAPVDRGVVFDGVRYSPGWIGCGLSYAAMANHALRNRLDRITILEDDAQVGPDFEEKMAIVQRYLDANEGRWDVFCGLIAVVHDDTRILRVDDFEGMRFITINRMVSTVCNVYSPRALQLLADWNPGTADEQTNTIDQYLGSRANLRAVLALPFVASLREELDSTLWGIGNGRYLTMIAESQQTLLQKTEAFLRGRIDPAAPDPAAPDAAAATGSVQER